MIDPTVRAAIDAKHPHGKAHRLSRVGEQVTCSCGVDSIHAPVLPNPPLTPMEASLSRFD